MALKYSEVNNTTSFLSQWQATALSAYGKKASIKNEKALANNFVQTISASKVTDFEKTVIALSAMGYNSKKFASNDGTTKDLVSSIANFTQSDIGVNGAMYALIAYQSGHFDLGENVYWTENKLIDYILANELPNGGYAYWGDTAETDLTAMAVTALSPYYETRSDVKALVDKLVNILSTTQNAVGGYDTSWGTDSSDSVAQVIVALSAMGIDLSADSRFIKNGYTLVDNLLTFKTANNEFLYATGGEESSISTEQAFLALVSYYKLKTESLSSYNVYSFEKAEGQINVKVLVQGNENQISNGNIDINEGSTALDAVKKVLSENNISFEETNGVFSKIGNEEAGRFNEGDSWHFAVNGVKFGKSMKDYILSKYDTVLVYYGNEKTDFADAKATVSKDSTDVSIYVSISKVAAANAKVYLDNEYVGNTDSLGNISISKEEASVGNHVLSVKLFDEKGLTKVINDTISLRVPKFETADTKDKVIPVSNEDVVIDFNENVSNASIDAKSLLSGNKATLPGIFAQNANITLTVLNDTVVSGPSGWNGKILLPFEVKPTAPNADILKGVTVGLESGSLTFDKPVRIFIPDTKGKKIGFIKPDGTIKEITKALSKDDEQTAVSELNSSSMEEGKVTLSNGTAIWTKHFTTFVAYTTNGSSTNDKVYISVANPKGTTYLYKTDYDFDNQTALSLLLSTGLNVTVKDGYVSSINGLSELDKGENSGWMFKVNGSFPNVSAGYTYLNAGDYVEWLYTQDLGADVGDTSYSGGGSSSKSYSDLYKSVDNTYLKQLVLALEDKNVGENDFVSTAKDKLLSAAKDIEAQNDKKDKEKLSKDILKITDLVVKKVSDVKSIKNALKEVLTKTSEYDFDNAVELGDFIVSKAGTFEVKNNVVSKDVFGNITEIYSFQKEIADIFKDEKLEKNISLKVTDELNGFTLKSYVSSNILSKGFDGLFVSFENGDIYVPAKELKSDDLYFVFERSDRGFDIGVTSGNEGLEKAVYYINSDKEVSSVKRNGEQAGTADGTYKDKAYVFTVKDTKNAEYVLVLEKEEENKETYFSDMKGYEWAEPSVNYLAEKGFVSGREEGKFDPESTITRAEFAAIVVRMFGDEGKISGNTVLSDVPANKWYYKEVYSAFELGFFKGKGDGKFDPESNITRQEVAVSAANLIKKFDLAKETNVDLTYKDDDAIASWAKDNVYFVLKRGVMQGYENKFNPENKITRAEAAVVLEKLAKGYVKN